MRRTPFMCIQNNNDNCFAFDILLFDNFITCFFSEHRVPEFKVSLGVWSGGGQVLGASGHRGQYVPAGTCG